MRILQNLDFFESKSQIEEIIFLTRNDVNQTCFMSGVYF